MPDPASAIEPVPAAKPSAPRYRIAQRSGTARDRPGPLGTHFATGEGSALSIDLPNGARLALEASSHAVLLDAEPAALVLLRGRLYAQLLPQGAVAGRPELRVVTVERVVSVPTAGELWLAQSDGRRGYVAILSGSVEHAQLGTPPAAAVSSEMIVAPRELGGGERARPPRTLDQARSAYAKSRERPAPSSSVAEADAALERGLTLWEAAESSADALLRRQRAAKQRADAEAVKEAQRRLVELARQKLAHRRSVRVAFELAAARRLAAPGADDAALAAFASGPGVRVAAAMPAGL